MITRDDPRFKWFAFGGALVCFIAAFVLVNYFKGSFAAPGKDDSYEFAADAEQGRDSARWKVYVTGAVVRPGLYNVSVGARIGDAIDRAGGFSSDGDPEAINLAERMEDGAHIKVPRRRVQGPNGAKGAAVDVPLAETRRDEPRKEGKLIGGNGIAAPINVNTAAREELQRLPGIGPTLSSAIVKYRETNGKFGKPEDLMKVNGIGKKRLERIRELVTF